MNRIKRFIVLFITIILLSGCVQSNITTRINKDKSMNLEVDVRLKSENITEDLIDTKSLEDRGFKVTTTNEEEYNVYKITRTFSSIDELSNGTKDTVDISDVLESGFDFSKLFVKTSSFFKDTYSANFIYSVDKLRNRYSSLLTLEDGSDVELKYTLIIPTKALNNDADEVSSDKKYLTWKLSTTEESKINYTFEILNTKHIIMAGGGALAIIIILIILIIIIKKKKSSKSSLIYKEYDPSIEGELNKNEIINTEATKVEAQSEVPTNIQTTVVDTTTGNIIEPTQTQTVEQKEEVKEEKVGEKAIEVPTVETAVDNMEMQKLPSLEFEVSDNMIPKEEEKEETFNFTPNTYDYNRRPDFVKSFEPNKFVDETKINSEEEVVIDTPSVTNNIDVPSYTEAPTSNEVSQNNAFIQNTQEPSQEVAPKPSVTAGLDIPNGVALSDMPSTK